MIATLRFSLPDEHAEFTDALNGSQWRGIVEVLKRELRDALKYQELHPETVMALETLRSLIYDEMQQRNVSDEL